MHGEVVFIVRMESAKIGYTLIMTALSSDTNSKAERIQLDLMRNAPAWRKIQMVAQLNETVRTLAMSGLSQRHPQATPAELRRLLADLVLGEMLAAQVYGPNQGK